MLPEPRNPILKIMDREMPALVLRPGCSRPVSRTTNCDGVAKYGRLLRPGQTPADAVVEEKRREDAIRDAGLRVRRWGWDDLDNFGPVATRLRQTFDAS